MAMSEAEFQALVTRLEQEWQEAPGRYRRRVLALGTLGYLYVGAVLLLLLALVWGMLLALTSHHGLLLLFKKLALPVLILIWMIGRALWVRIEPPQGIELTADEYPVLFKALASIRKKLCGPALHKVLLTDDFNAAIVQVPRLGLFGWHRNYLLLGLPLMSALSPQQFLAVLAHEYGHLSGAHGKSGAWVYRIRSSWYRLMGALEQEQHWGSRLFARFFNWYAPYFNAYSYVMARAHEYEADAASARVAGAANAGSALVNVTLAGSYLNERFWPALYRQANEQPTPLASPYHDMRLLLRKDLDRGEARQWLEKNLTLKTDPWDTHPALAERLAALNQAAQLPEPHHEDAARYFLGERLDALVKGMSEQWRLSIEASWAERHEHIQASRKQLQQLEERLAQGEVLTGDDAFDRARAVEELQSAEEALPHYRLLVEREPDYPHAHYALGRLLVEAGDAAGIDHVERAMALEPSYISYGCQLLYPFYREQGRDEEAQRCIDRYQERQTLEARQRLERDQLSAKDEFTEHSLDAEARASLQEQLQGYPFIKRAWLVRKVLQHSSAPLYLLAVECRFTAFFRESKRLALQQRLASEMSFPGESFVVILGGENRNFRKVVRRVSGSQIFGQ